MAESFIPVDLLNPGQVFACLGFLEAAEVLLGDAKAVFDWSDARGTKFSVMARGEEPPVKRVLRFLADAEVVARAPHGSRSLQKWKPKWGGCEFDDPGHPFPFRDPGSPAMLPAVLREPGGPEVAIEYWGDTTRRDKAKFWTGMAGYPGAAIVRAAVESAGLEMLQYEEEPFSLARRQSSSLRFDWRRDNIPTQDGFSANKHSSIGLVGFPLVDVLAAVGMTHARPLKNDETKLEYRYGVLGRDERRLFLEPTFHRAALGLDRTPVAGLPFRSFVMRLDWSGKEGQARSITQVHEEEIPR